MLHVKTIFRSTTVVKCELAFSAVLQCTGTINKNSYTLSIALIYLYSRHYAVKEIEKIKSLHISLHWKTDPVPLSH